MGIAGIYGEIGPGRRVALSKFAAEHYERHGRPLRLAIDISIWLFQIQSGKGGTSPALRTFYYRLLRMLLLNIHPLFVFDGKYKPKYKRNKRVGTGTAKVVSIDEFLAKDLLGHFGFPMHRAPGEAEAECALLQREGIVDAVMSEDVDTLMFGSVVTMRNWTPEKSSKTPTHVNVYDARITKSESSLDREGMILIAMMSGGDYLPDGLAGCGIKIAYEAAKAGFGAELCKLGRSDDAGYTAWRERLRHELWTNESGFFGSKKRAVKIPDDFPNREVLGYYTSPRVSTASQLVEIRRGLKWDQPIDFPKLRAFARNAFDWTCISGAKKFIRNLAPAILTRELRLRAEQGANDNGDLETQAAAEQRLVLAIHGKREHASTDEMPEIRISFVPIKIIDLDLSQEPPDEDDNLSEGDDELEGMDDAEGEPTSTQRKRGPSTYDPEVPEKIWMFDLFLRQGIPLKYQDWVASFSDPKSFLAAKRAAKEATAKKKKTTTGGMPRGALDAYTKVIKPGISRSAKEPAKEDDRPTLEAVDLSGPTTSENENRAPNATDVSGAVRTVAGVGTSAAATRATTLTNAAPGLRMPKSVIAQSTWLASLEEQRQAKEATSGRKRPSPIQRHSPRPAPHGRSRSATPKTGRFAQTTIIDLLSSPDSPAKSTAVEITRVPRRLDFGTPSRDPGLDDAANLPRSVTVRKRSPMKKVETAPAGLAAFSNVGCEPNIAFDEVDLSGIDPVPATFERPGPPRLNKNLSSSTTTSIMPAALEHADPMDEFVANDNATNATTVPVSLGSKTGRTHFRVRESLEGRWEEVDALLSSSPISTQVSLRTAAPAVQPNRTRKEAKSWRRSQVECVDLTGDD